MSSSSSIITPPLLNESLQLQQQSLVLYSNASAGTVMPFHINASTCRNSTVVNTTLKSYESAVNTFLQFVSAYNLIAVNYHEVDVYLSQYIESLYANNTVNGKQIAANTIYGVIHRCPQLKLELPLSRQSLKGYQKLKPSKSHLPFTYFVCIAVSATMSRNGNIHHAVALLLMFHCYLRINEMFDLLISDIALPDQNRFGSSIILSSLRIAKSKTGVNQSVSITDIHIQKLLEFIIGNRSRDEKLFSFSSLSVFTSVLHKSLLLLGLPLKMFVPHSCRHGGATYDHINGKNIEDIMLRGRWKSNSSARNYIQSLKALILTTNIPDNIHIMGKSCVQDLYNNILNLFTLSQS